MIQLEPGIPPASLNKPTHSAGVRKNRMEKKKNGGLRVDVVSDAAVAPFDQIEWECRTAEITDGGKVIFKQEEIEVPKNWSALATRKSPCRSISTATSPTAPTVQKGRETSVRQVNSSRTAYPTTDCGIADSYFADAEAAETFYDELPGCA